MQIGNRYRLDLHLHGVSLDPGVHNGKDLGEDELGDDLVEGEAGAEVDIVAGLDDLDESLAADEKGVGSDGGDEDLEDGELDEVVRGGEEGAEAGNGVGDDDGGPSELACGAAGGHEDAGAHHPAEAETDEIDPGEGAGHVGARAGPDPAHLLVGGGDGGGPVGQAAGGLGEGVAVGL